MMYLRKATKEEKEAVDNLIVTFIKLYPQNLTYALTRVAEIKDMELHSVRQRYYSYIRWKRGEELFILSSDKVVLSNTKAQTTEKILEQLEDQI